MGTAGIGWKVGGGVWAGHGMSSLTSGAWPAEVSFPAHKSYQGREEMIQRGETSLAANRGELSSCRCSTFIHTKKLFWNGMFGSLTMATMVKFSGGKQK